MDILIWKTLQNTQEKLCSGFVLGFFCGVVFRLFIYMLYKQQKNLTFLVKL